MTFQPSVLTGMTPTQLQAALASAQAALVSLQTGTKPETVSYAQGDGTRSVTFTRANIGNLTYFITELQRALGLRRRRRAIGFHY